MKTILCSIFLFFVCINSFKIQAQTLTTTTTMHSIGIYIEDADTISVHHRVDVQFREQGNMWRAGLGLSSLIINGQQVFAGSILQLKENTSYDLNITITDSLPLIHSFNFTTTVTTQAEPVSTGTTDTLWVSPNGSGSLYSFSQPGSMTTLFGSDASLIDCGTAILCRGGTYYVGDLDLNLNANSGNCYDSNMPIIIGSAPGETAIMDGSDTSALAVFPNWTLYDAANHIYSATLPIEVSNSTLMLYDDSIRLFPYATHSNPIYMESLENAPSYFGSGFSRTDQTFYIRLENNEDPNGHKITVSKHEHFLSVYNFMQYRTKIIVQNLDIRFYGKPDVLSSPARGSTALSLWSIDNATIENCRFEYNTMSILMFRSCQNLVIRNCNFLDQTGYWMHGKFKNSSLTTDNSDDLAFLGASRLGRSLEKAAIFFQPDPNTPVKNIQIYGNTINGIVSGIAGNSFESSPYYDVDLFENTMLNNYDAFDVVGNVVNYRVWSNRISNSPVVFSLIPHIEGTDTLTCLGPAYIFRNVADHIVTRRNIDNTPVPFHFDQEYINYGGCDGGIQHKVWGTALKMETGLYPSNKRLDLYLLHNTFNSEDSLSYNLYLWKSTWRKLVSKNNSYSSRFTTVNFEDVLNVNTYSFHSSSDNFYSVENPIANVNEVHGNFSTCHAYSTISDFDLGLKTITGSNNPSILNIASYKLMPNYVDEVGGDYHLNQSSQLIDAGEIVPNISDLFVEQYLGAKPDIGAFEYPYPASLTEVSGSNKVICYPNPSNGTFRIRFAESGVQASFEVVDQLGKDLAFSVISLQDHLFEINLPQSEGIYFLKIKTESGIYLEKLTVLNR